jgi:DNA anti-recombination protein RmuC
LLWNIAVNAIVLDTLAYAKKLRTAGFSEQQAEIQAEALAEVVDKQLATRADMEAHENILRRDLEVVQANLRRDIAELRRDTEGLRADLKRDMEDMRGDLKRDLEELRTELKRDMEELRTELKRDIRELELRFEARLSETKADLIRWVVGVGVLQFTLIAALLLKLSEKI